MDNENHDNCPHHRLIRLPEVLHMTGLSRSVLLGLEKGGEFPASVRTSPRCVAWWECEVRQWMDSRPKNH